MSERGIIEAEPKQQCDFCGKIAELRPYGPKREVICFDCMMKNEEAGKQQFKKQVLENGKVLYNN